LSDYTSSNPLKKVLSLLRLPLHIFIADVLLTTYSTVSGFLQRYRRHQSSSSSSSLSSIAAATTVPLAIFKQGWMKNECNVAVEHSLVYQNTHTQLYSPKNARYKIYKHKYKQ